MPSASELRILLPIQSVAFGKHTARRIVVAQCLAAGLAALLGLLHGLESALAVLAGGLIVAGGTALLAWRLFIFGVAPVKNLVNSVYVAVMIKWIWVVATLYVAIAVWHLSALALIAGMLVAHVAFYFVSIKFR